MWLGDLLKGSKASLHKVIRDASITTQDPKFNLIDFENSYPAQVGVIFDRENQGKQLQSENSNRSAYWAFRWFGLRNPKMPSTMLKSIRKLCKLQTNGFWTS
jgi:hypothetical protein